MIAIPPTVAAPEEVAGKYLTFRLGQESFAIPVLQVREIFLAPEEVETTPSPSGLRRGTATLRGQEVPVIDLRRRIPFPGEGYVIAAETGSSALLGLMVDDVEEIADIPDDDIQAPSRFGPAEPDHAPRTAKTNDGFTTLLDIDRIAATE